MYTLQDLINEIEFQTEFVVVIYDEDQEQRYQVDPNNIIIKEIKVKYMYVENDILFIELNYCHFTTYCEEIGTHKQTKYLRKI